MSEISCGISHMPSLINLLAQVVLIFISGVLKDIMRPFLPMARYAALRNAVLMCAVYWWKIF